MLSTAKYTKYLSPKLCPIVPKLLGVAGVNTSGLKHNAHLPAPLRKHIAYDWEARC